MMQRIIVRPVEISERGDWEVLWKNYLEFYKTTLPEEITASTWERLHDPSEPMGVLGAYVDGRLCGFAHYLFHRSCWAIKDSCYMQDLFVAESCRKLGLGRRLIEAVEKVARDHGASTLYWSTQESNATARKLYDKIVNWSGFIQYRKPL